MKKLLVVLVAVLILVGCGKKSPLLGTWNGDTQDGLNTTFIFEKDGNVEYKNEYVGHQLNLVYDDEFDTYSFDDVNFGIETKTNRIVLWHI